LTSFTKGLHEVGNGHYAYLQPSGTWGYSNAGLVIDGDQSLLVDTLFDELMTAQMLGEMQARTRVSAGEITQLVNTHANGDHTFGNRLVTNARIIASAAGAEEVVGDRGGVEAEIAVGVEVGVIGLGVADESVARVGQRGGDELAGGLRAIHDRHANIHEDDVHRFNPRQLNGPLTVICG